MKTIIFAAALGATTLSGAACAQDTPDARTPPRAMGHMGGGMGAGALMRADLNHDGVITRDEVIADADQRFAAMDADHNGTVTADERRAAMANMREQRAVRRGNNAPPPPPTANADAGKSGDLGFAGRGMGMRGDRGGRAGRDMTQAQFRDRALRMFDRVDTNHNGQVDKNEIDAARMLMRARMSGGDAPAPAGTPSNDQ